MANADKNPKAIEEWVHNISKLQKTKTVDTVQYRKSVFNQTEYSKFYSFSFRPMPDIDGLMQEWPTQFEELLREVWISAIFFSIDLSFF